MSSSQATPLYVMFVRTFWMFLGPMLLFLLVYSIASTGGGWLTVLDLLFFVVLVGVLLSRLSEYASGYATNAYGGPVTPLAIRRYATAVGLGGLLVWFLANVLGNHLLGD